MGLPHRTIVEETGAAVMVDYRARPEAEQRRARIDHGWLRRFWPCIVGVLCLWASLAQILTDSLQRNDGHFIYAFDDPYIHMAVAKNFLLHGVWGVTPYGFTSSTSSILWPILLVAAYEVTGVNDYV